MVMEWQARVFTQPVEPGQEDRYRLPIALKEFALTELGGIPDEQAGPRYFSGILYLSIALELGGNNFAILPEEVDKKLALFEVSLIVVDHYSECVNSAGDVERSWNTKLYDTARPDSEGNLVWGERSQIWYASGFDVSKVKPKLLLPGQPVELPPVPQFTFQTYR
jgi:hypothetical protein